MLLGGRDKVLLTIGLRLGFLVFRLSLGNSADIILYWGIREG